MQFAACERLRLEVASRAFRKLDVNLQTGWTIAKETTGVVAAQTVCHDRARPSQVELPVVR